MAEHNGIEWSIPEMHYLRKALYYYYYNRKAPSFKNYLLSFISLLFQLSKATRSDMLVRELYLENTQLMRVVQMTEARQKEAEESTREYQMATLLHKS